MKRAAPVGALPTLTAEQQRYPSQGTALIPSNCNRHHLLLFFLYILHVYRAKEL